MLPPSPAALAALARLELARARTHRGALATDVVLAVTDVALQLALLGVFVGAAAGTATWPGTVVYVLVAAAALTVSALRREPDVASTAATGGATTLALRPPHLCAQVVAAELGRTVADLPRALPLLAGAAAVAVATGTDLAPGGYLAAQACGLVLATALATAFYTPAVVAGSGAGPKALLQACAAFASGAVVPLTLWPHGLAWVQHLPFALVVDAPVRVLLGTAAPGPVVAEQLLWTALLLLLDLTVGERLLRLRPALGA